MVISIVLGLATQMAGQRAEMHKKMASNICSKSAALLLTAAGLEQTEP